MVLGNTSGGRQSELLFVVVNNAPLSAGGWDLKPIGVISRQEPLTSQGLRPGRLRHV